MEPECYGWQEWEEQVIDNWLTINDVLKLVPGEEIELLVLDRNVYDVACDINVEEEKYTAKHFFRNNRAIYIHDQDMKGTLTLYVDNDPIEMDNFEFHIEWKKGNWYPLKNGKLPKKDSQGFSKFPSGMKIDWKEYPITTHIGYRGPIIKWDKVDDLPNIYYKYDD